MSHLTALARAVVPVECPGCGLPDEPWCQECAAPWWDAPLRCESGAARLEVDGAALPVWSVAVLEGPVHALMGAWKDQGRRDLDRFLGEAMQRAAAAIAPALAGMGPLRVAACPARPAHTRRRGADLPAALAARAAAGLRSSGLAALPVRALSAARGGSRGAGDRARWRERPARATRAARIAGGAPAPLLLVDDVATTGATLARACAALAGTALVPVAGLVLASAPAVGEGSASALGWSSQDDERLDTFKARR